MLLGGPSSSTSRTSLVSFRSFLVLGGFALCAVLIDLSALPESYSLSAIKALSQLAPAYVASSRVPNPHRPAVPEQYEGEGEDASTLWEEDNDDKEAEDALESFTSDPGVVAKMIQETNEEAADLLKMCVRFGTCVGNRPRIVIFANPHFIRVLSDGYVGGEEMWAKSIKAAFERLRYTIFYADSPYQALQLYGDWPGHTRYVIMNPNEIFMCSLDVDCIYSPLWNPEGLPLHSIFAFSFWWDAAHPLGSKWTLNPENYTMDGVTRNQYVGYSVEDSCLDVMIPSKRQRQKKRQAYVYAKWMSYFSRNSATAWPREFYDRAAESLGPLDAYGADDSRLQSGAKFVAGVRDDSDLMEIETTTDEDERTLPKSIRNLGFMTPDHFIDAIKSSSVLIGVGNPRLSPTPYQALCLGVPFINPIESWAESEPDNPLGWSSQHGILQEYGPPYVYNVKRGDEAGFRDAIEQAINNPIDRFIPERMTMDAVTDRVKRIFAKDWEVEARILLEERVLRGSDELFDIPGVGASEWPSS